MTFWPSLDTGLVPARLFHEATGDGPQAHVEYQTRPVDWIVEKLGIPRHTLVWSSNEGFMPHKWDGTPDPIVALLEGLANWEDVGVESGTGCIYGDAEMVINRGGNGSRLSLRDLVTRFNGGRTKGQQRHWDLTIPTCVQREVDGVVRLTRIANAWSSGMKTTYTVTTETGRQVRATDEHPFLTERGWLRLDQLVPGDLVHVRGKQGTGKPKAGKKNYRQISGLIGHPYAGRVGAARHASRYPYHRAVAEARSSGVPLEEFVKRLRAGSREGLVFFDPEAFAVHHLDGDHQNNVPYNLAVMTHEEHHRIHALGTDGGHALLCRVAHERVVSVELYGEEETFDIEVEDDPHNFIADGFVVHNTGKSFTGACAVLWFLACWHNSIVNTYAPKEDQLRLFIWKEISALWPRFRTLFPTAELTDLRIRMNGNDKWAAHGIATALRAGETSATRAQGAHAEHMLLITEETPGVETPVMTALRNTRSGRHNLMLALGNPDHQQDTLHRFCTLPDTRHIVISSLDHPNVVCNREIIPGAASKYGIARIAAEDAPGSAMYESRVRGISPAEATDSLIKLTWIRQAAERYDEAMQKAERWAMGVDVANSEKGDKAARAYGKGMCLVRVKTHQCPRADVLGAEVVEEALKLGIDPAHVGVDPIGVGASAVNKMLELGFTPRQLAGGDSTVDGAQRAPDGSSMDYAPDANRFLNLRSQMAWQLREDFRLGHIAVEPALAEHLARELTAPRYEKRNGLVVLEPKDKLKKRVGHSPDEFDSVMYWNWVRPRSEIVQTREASDDQHPGYDYKAKRRLPRRASIGSDGTVQDLIEDDVRERFMPFGGERFRGVRWGGLHDTDEEDDE